MSSNGPDPKYQFKKGQSGNPKGRPKGSKSSFANYEIRERLAKAKQSPLEYLVGVYLNENESKSARMGAAIACLPYMHRKMPTDQTVTYNDPAQLAESVREHIRAAGLTVKPPQPEGDDDGVE